MNENQKLQLELVYAKRKKEKWISFLLCLFLGPFGFVYTSSWGGLITSFILLSFAYFATTPLLIIGEVFLGGFIWLAYFVCLFWWALSEVDEYNKELREELESTFNN